MGNTGSALIPVVAALVGAILGAASSYLGVAQSVESQISQQQRQFSEQRATAAADQRAAVYFAYLEVANEFAVAATDVLTSAEGDVDGGLALTLDGAFAARYQTARFKFQDATNDLYVYGSDEAVRLGQQIGESLPSALVGLERSFTVSEVDPDKFKATYVAFLAVVCREVPAVPRSGC